MNLEHLVASNCFLKTIWSLVVLSRAPLNYSYQSYPLLMKIQSLSFQNGLATACSILYFYCCPTLIDCLVRNLVEVRGIPPSSFIDFTNGHYVGCVGRWRASPAGE